MDYNMSADLGLMDDKQMICSCHGILSRNNHARNLCGRFVKNGINFYDAVTRYCDICTYALGRTGNLSPSSNKLIVPFLKAYEVSDHVAMKFAEDDVQPFAGAKEMMNYADNTQPVFISTASFEHHMMALCDEIGFPMTSVGCSRAGLDSFDICRSEMKTLREFADKISENAVSDSSYIFSNASMLNFSDTALLALVDDIREKMSKMEFYNDYDKIESVGVNEKAYALIEIRKKTEIEFSSTMYVGSEASDSQALDLIKDSDGLALSYNGERLTVENSNVAAMSEDATVLAVLNREFYNGGIESVYSLIENWTPQKLEKMAVPKDHPIKELLRRFPDSLPFLERVTRKNVNEISEKSEKYRRAILQ